MKNWLEYLVEQNKHKRIVTGSVKVSILLDSDIEIPNFQRDSVQQHVDEIASYLHTTKSRYGKYEMLGIITIGYFKKMFFMIDGQHRYFAIKSLYENKDVPDEEDWEIGISILRCTKYSEMSEAFLSLNKAVPIAKHLRFSDNVDEADRLNEIKSYLSEQMADYFSKSKDTKRANRPNFLSVDKFVDMFVEKHKPTGVQINLDFFLEENRKWGEVLKSRATVCWYAHKAVELVHQKVTGKPLKNRELKGLATEDSKYVKVKKDGRTTEPLYLGCYYFSNDAYPTEPSKEIRCIVRDLWFRFVKEKAGQIPDAGGNVGCVVCAKHFVSPTMFHLGHIHSKDQGGLPHIDNLVPICQSCNTTMSIVHMRDYCEKKGSRGWDTISAYLEYVRQMANVFKMNG